MMKHYSHQTYRKVNEKSEVEFASEFAPLDHYLDQEAQRAFLSAKACGMITKRLVEVGEQMLIKNKTKND